MKGCNKTLETNIHGGSALLGRQLGGLNFGNEAGPNTSCKPRE